ncbi:hypothetical protein [Flavobacterium sp.]|uniref:hypothetical protein n=1 Tax=Flavobacterium sp. TaxID=239 RepID=UPI003528480D
MNTDELELLKRDWKKNESSYNQVTEKQIYGMLHKRSSSIVKWILIISVLEIVFWLSLNFAFNDDKYNKMIELYHLKTFILVGSIVNYTGIAVFIYIFYKNYTKIKTTDTIKALMRNILNTRKSVNYYVVFNLVLFTISMIVTLWAQFTYSPEMERMLQKVNGGDNSLLAYFIIAFVCLIFVGIGMLLLWLFYKLLYGILLKKLNKNYKELEKFEL